VAFTFLKSSLPYSVDYIFTQPPTRKSTALTGKSRVEKKERSLPLLGTEIFGRELIHRVRGILQVASIQNDSNRTYPVVAMPTRKKAVHDVAVNGLDVANPADQETRSQKTQEFKCSRGYCETKADAEPQRSPASPNQCVSNLTRPPNK